MTDMPGFPLFLPTLRGERATRRGDEHVLRGPRSFSPRTAFLCVTRNCHNTDLHPRLTGSPGNASRPHFDYQRTKIVITIADSNGNWPILLSSSWSSSMPLNAKNNGKPMVSRFFRRYKRRKIVVRVIGHIDSNWINVIHRVCSAWSMIYNDI